MQSLCQIQWNRALISLFLILTVIVQQGMPQPPINNYVDPAMTYYARGANPFYPETNEYFFQFMLSPFYQHAAGAKPGKNEQNQCCPTPPPVAGPDETSCCAQKCIPSCKGQKVPEGDRLGRWNMIGLLQGTGAAPCCQIVQDCLPNLYAAQQEILPLGFLTEEFKDGFQQFGYFSVPVNYQKVGLRAMARFYLGYGFGITARSGVARYRQVPCFIDKTCDAKDQAYCDCDGTQKVFTCDQIRGVEKALMSAERRCDIARDICLNIAPYSHTGPEDTHAQIDWGGTFQYHNDENELMVTVLPYAAAGIWFPTGSKQNPDIAFSLPLGGNGFYGGTLDAGLNFSFPGTVVFGMGAALTIYDSKIQPCQRVPTNCNQSGIYPWKTTIKRKPGLVWNAHLDLAAYNFIPKLSFFFNYIYTKHEHDNIELENNNCLRFPDEYGNCYTNCCFPMYHPEKLEAESAWDSQVLNIAFEYEVTKKLFIGAAAQVPITGARVYKTSTIIGTIQFNF